MAARITGAAGSDTSIPESTRPTKVRSPRGSTKAPVFRRGFIFAMSSVMHVVVIVLSVLARLAQGVGNERYMWSMRNELSAELVFGYVYKKLALLLGAPVLSETIKSGAGL